MNVSFRPPNNSNILLLIPIFGILLFFIFYFTSTLFYPGGSQIDKASIGFSWANNYWCNLLNKNALNGQINKGRPIALAGMFLLCIALGYFWYIFPSFLKVQNNIKLIIQFSGIGSMAIAMFLFSGLHDLIINIASFLGIIALVATLIGLYKTQWNILFYFGIINLLLTLINNFFYYNTGLIIYLPIIQKLSFLSFLFWFCCINFKLYKTTLVARLKNVS